MDSIADMTREVLRVDSLGCVRGSTQVLQDVRFSVSSGQFISVIGPNGSGKTSLLRCILGLYPYRGEVEICGDEVSKLSRSEIARRVAYMPQVWDRLPDYSVREFLEMSRYCYRKTGSLVHNSIIDDAIELADIGSFVTRKLGTLSGGEQRRVVLAGVLAQGVGSCCARRAYLFSRY